MTIYDIEEKEPYFLNYLALAHAILSDNKFPDLHALGDKKKAKERMEEIERIRAAGGKTELEILFEKHKHEKKVHKGKKTYVYDIDLNILYTFVSRVEAIKTLKLKKNDLNNIDRYKVIKNTYIISSEKINIKQIKEKDYLYILENGYPKGLFYIENENGHSYLSIDNREELIIKKHDCKEDAIVHLLDKTIK